VNKIGDREKALRSRIIGTSPRFSPEVLMPTAGDANGPPQTGEITSQQVRSWLEVGCWTTLGLVPFLVWVNGAAVSTDQFVVRIVLVMLAAFAVIGLRLFAWWEKRQVR
jgi:hypothetical protein